MWGHGMEWKRQNLLNAFYVSGRTPGMQSSLLTHRSIRNLQAASRRALGTGFRPSEVLLVQVYSCMQAVSRPLRVREEFLSERVYAELSLVIHVTEPAVLTTTTSRNSEPPNKLVCSGFWAGHTGNSWLSCAALSKSLAISKGKILQF